MAEKIVKKKYYRISFGLASPLAVGSGENENTDKDIALDTRGIPYIPASSLAGVVREKLEKEDEAKAKLYLGDVRINRGKRRDIAEASSSPVIFYDARITAGMPRVTIRDSVALDEYKTAKAGAKFDMEVLEPGVTFTTYTEQSFTEELHEDYGAEIAEAFRTGRLLFGGKSMRGYGAIKDVEISSITFDLRTEADRWLDFDLYAELNGWENFAASEESGRVKELRLSLKQNGGISIRRYTTKVSDDDRTEPDMEQLTIGEEKHAIPVIPGTSWAGAIRHRMGEFGVNTEGKGSIFGYVKGQSGDNKSRSKIRFSESQLKGGYFKNLSRNAIDRFTGGTVDGALFTERTYYNGTTELVIGWNDAKGMPETEKKALAAALTDLHYGFLAVGGETSIGRGMFTIERIQGEELHAEDGSAVYGKILSKVEEAFDDNP